MAVYGAWVDSILNPYMSGMTIKALLVASGYTQDPTHQYRADVTELSTTGYPAGGISVSASVTYDPFDYSLKLTDTGTLSFGTFELSGIGGVAFYEDTGNAATDRLIAFDPFEVEVTGVKQFEYIPNVDGLVLVTFDSEGA